MRGYRLVGAVVKGSMRRATTESPHRIWGGLASARRYPLAHAQLRAGQITRRVSVERRAFLRGGADGGLRPHAESIAAGRAGVKCARGFPACPPCAFAPFMVRSSLVLYQCDVPNV